MATFRLYDLNLVSATAKGDEGNSFSVDPAMSGNGAKIAFRSNATNLVPQDTNRSGDLFVKDTVTGEVIRANTAANGAQANASVGVSKSLSDDGRKVAFITAATNLVPGDTNKVDDALVKDLKTGAIIRASAAADGTQANRETNDVSLSPDGGKAVLTSLATNLTPGDTNRVFDVFIKDLKTGAVPGAKVRAGMRLSEVASAHCGPDLFWRCRFQIRSSFPSCRVATLRPWPNACWRRTPH